jgi:hypothetical protein
MHSTSGRVLTTACIVTALIADVGIVLDGGWQSLLAFGALPLLFAAVVWTLFDRPYVRVTDGGVEICNLLRTVQIPWPAVTDIELRWGLKLITKFGNYTAWSVPPPPRPKFRVGRGPAGGIAAPRGGAYAGENAIPGPRSPNQAARAAMDRWQSLQQGGYLEDPRLEFDAPLKQWNQPQLIVLGILALFSAAGILGYQLG